MPSSSFNIVNDSISDELPTLNVYMLKVDNIDFAWDNNNINVVRSSALVNSLHRMAAENGGKTFNIFLTSSESKSPPHRDHVAIQSETKGKIVHLDKIENIRFTMFGSIIEMLNVQSVFATYQSS